VKSRPVRPAAGFTLIELMIALALGLIVIAGIITVFLALGRVSTTALSQASIQNAQNTISAILSPTIRGAGFGGCRALTNSLSTITPGPGTLVNNYSIPVQGYDFAGTAGVGAYAIAADNAPNDPTAGDWLPAPGLDPSFATAGIATEPGSDVLVVSGEMPGTAPAGVNTIPDGAPDFVVTDNPTSNVAATLAGEGLPAPGALSDCGKSVVFMVTATADAAGAVTIAHAAPANFTPTFQPSFPPGVQFVPLQQAAFYVASSSGGQSALYKAIYTGGAWVATPIVPGVENMQVLYGVTTNGTYQWLPAAAVATGPGFGSVSAVQIGFLIEGGIGSKPFGPSPPFTVLGTAVAVPTDSRLRHVFEITANLRNVSL
jgi:type IV pilus assembly protein PilW